ncbi:MAG: hypothetical protein EOO12_04070 [Chitinophagaceae bacterium]|nr:MAG: hypothetical protein EOO12_04070 [Chitinophagaceae bacterium]
MGKAFLLLHAPSGTPSARHCQWPSTQRLRAPTQGILPSDAPYVPNDAPYVLNDAAYAPNDALYPANDALYGAADATSVVSDALYLVDDAPYDGSDATSEQPDTLYSPLIRLREALYKAFSRHNDPKRSKNELLPVRIKEANSRPGASTV